MEILSPRDQFRRNVHGGVWRGADLQVAERIIATPGVNSVVVAVTQSSLPPLDKIPYPGEYLGGELPLPSAMRSRWAQLGMEMGKHADNYVATAVAPHLEDGRLPTGMVVNVPVNLINRSQQPISLDEGTRLFRFYTDWTGKRLTGEDLEKAVASGLIDISGNQHDTWDFAYKKGTASGIYFAIDQRFQGWLPPNPGGEPIDISNDARNFRQLIDQLLRPVPEETTDRILWIGQTAAKVRLQLKESAILAKEVYRRVDNDIAQPNFLPHPEARQTRSQVFDPGKTAYQLRLEILSRIKKGNMPTHVLLSFYTTA